VPIRLRFPSWAEVVDVSFLDKGLQQNVWYPVEVKVKNNNHYTERYVNVEIRVRSGPSKIRGSNTSTSFRTKN